MGSLVSLAIYAVIAAAAVGAVYAGVQSAIGWISAPRVEAQRLSDQKYKDASDANAKAAELERDNAKEDTKACVAISDKQNKLIESWKAAADANAKAAREARDRASREATAAAPRIADLQAKAAAAPKLMACEEERDKARSVLADQLRRARGLPTTPVPAAPPGLVK